MGAHDVHPHCYGSAVCYDGGWVGLPHARRRISGSAARQFDVRRHNDQLQVDDNRYVRWQMVES